MSTKKIYFASDAHLGARSIQNPKEHEKKLVRWLDFIKHDAAAVYFMGDMLDFWFEYKKTVPRGFVRFFGKLAELTDSGIEIHWFTGNHDIWIFDYIPKELGVIVHKKPEEIRLGEKNFFLAHGDGLADKSKSFKIVRSLFHNRFCQRLFSCIHPRWAIGMAHAWSNHSRENGENIPYLGENNEFLVLFSKEYLKTHPDIHFFIFGHRHILLDLMLAENSRIIILGDWISHFSYAAFDGENLSLLLFENQTLY
ncbi:MAG: UDP-2,3-diacylglucosamine diphosphatase [Candidatus Azobacteroides sp.]|nr:UDP-2,3-diacylglucosamine diphosphatase [Candidatus Azobacteroides sp.]